MEISDPFAEKLVFLKISRKNHPWTVFYGPERFFLTRTLFMFLNGLSHCHTMCSCQHGFISPTNQLAMGIKIIKNATIWDVFAYESVLFYEEKSPVKLLGKQPIYIYHGCIKGCHNCHASKICVKYLSKVRSAIRRGLTCRVINAACPTKSSSKLQDSTIGLYTQEAFLDWCSIRKIISSKACIFGARQNLICFFSCDLKARKP